MAENYKEITSEILRISGADPKKCMQCGKCSGACPAYSAMEYHPHQFSYLIRSGNVEELLKSDASLYCLSCFACSERCPRGVQPAKLIEAVRLQILREQDGDAIKPEDIPCLLDENLPQQALVSAFRKYRK